MMERLQRMPVPVLPTFVGAITLSNVYAGMGYPWVRYLTVAAATIVMALYIIKILCYPKVCVNEYKNTIPCSLYAAFPMVLMLLGSFYNEFIPGIGKPVLLFAVTIHALHICIFTLRNVIMTRNVTTTMPSWFVTYNGIMVSCVAGATLLPKGLTTVITWYGIVIYFVLLPVMIWRLIKFEVKPPIYHTMAVLLAPCSLCLVSAFNILENPSVALIWALYICVLGSLLFIIIKLPSFFSFNFTPGFAGLTFPMAIGLVATTRMTGWLTAQSDGTGGAMVEFTKQLGGIQLYLTTMIIGYVLLNMAIMALRTKRPE